MKGSRILSIARKEFRHIFRDPFTLGMALGLPVLLVVFFGYLIDFDVRRVPMAVFDQDRSRASREMVDLIGRSDYFRPVQPPAGTDAAGMLTSERARLSLIIEPGFQKALRRRQPAAVQVLLDGADNSVSGVVLGYLETLQRTAARRLAGIDDEPPPRLESRYLFNPELNSRWFVIPGLAVVVLGVFSVLLTSLTIAREWENGSMELMLSTPVKPLEIILGKLAPYTVLGLASVVFVYLAARGLFDVPFRGSHAVFAAATLLFLATTLSQGLVISVVTRQQQLAMQFGIVSGLLPSMLLSGFVFPVENMPLFFRYFTMILPARWFMAIARGIFLRGAGWTDLAVPLAALGGLAALLITAAARRFRTDLEP